MLFNTLHFLGFFVAVFALYWAFQPRWRLQNLLLLAASYFFYGYWDERFLLLILASTVVDYFCGLGFERPGLSARGRRWILLASLGVNLGALGFFKYFGFFVESAETLLTAFGFSPSRSALSIVLPVGISFYTFQTLSYTIDRCRGLVPVERDFPRFALFVSFFPQLVAGPIVRARDFLPQAGRARVFRWSDQALGFRLALWGLFKKAVVADNLAPFVDGTFGAEGQLGIGVRLLAVYAFCVQIYCDFSGYTDIARGVARMLGFHLSWNFRMPYFARNPREFWERWHITLSTWLRDYLYIPLGGNRGGIRRTAINLMLTMVLGGLWHGAAWNFVLWGFYQGLLLVLHRAWIAGRKVSDSLLARCLSWFVFFQLVNLGWLFFRAESLRQIVELLTPGSAGFLAGLDLSEQAALGLVLGGLGTLVVLVWDLALRGKDDELPGERQGPAFQVALVLFLYLAVSLCGRFANDAFIYFQF